MENEQFNLDDYPATPSVTITLQGTRHAITPFHGEQLPVAIRISRPIMEYFGALPATGEIRVDWAWLLEHHFDGACELAALELGWGRDRIYALQADQLVDLLRAILQVNLDFFFLRMQPSLARLARAVARHTSASAKPGSASSAADIRRPWSWLTRWRKSAGG